jgi:hypothetical protein
LLLQTFYTARQFEDSLKVNQDDVTKIQTQLIQENSYLRSICENQISSPKINPGIKSDCLSAFLEVNQEARKHKKTATAIFDDTVCFKINLKDEVEPEEQSTRTPIEDEIELPSKDNCVRHTTSGTGGDTGSQSSMLKKLSLFKSKPKLYLFHSNASAANATKTEDVNIGKGVCNTSDNLLSRNKLF